MVREGKEREIEGGREGGRERERERERENKKGGMGEERGRKGRSV